MTTREGARDVDRVPDAAVQLRLREAVDDRRPARRAAPRRSSATPPRARLVVEPAGEPAATARRRRAGRRSASRRACRRAASRRCRTSTGMRGSASWAVTTSQNAFSVSRLAPVEEDDRRHVLDAVEDDAAASARPSGGLLEDVVVGVAADHLRRRAALLPRQVVRVGVSRRSSTVRSRSRPQRSRLTIAASKPSAPTRQSDPGARSGGPMTRL